MTEINLDKCYEVCLFMAREAGKMITDALQKPRDFKTKTCDVDIVTKTDFAVEKFILDTLQDTFPDHLTMAEESSKANPVLTNQPTWIIDPVDGSLNFIHGFEQVAISIALFLDKEPVIGIVYNPAMDQMFTARKGQGAFLNGKQIHASGQKEFSKALFCIDLMTDKVRYLKRHECMLKNLDRIIGKTHGIRIVGSAALSMALVAAGQMDVYYEYGIQAWDMAAGQLLIQEAGGCIISPNGEPFDVMKRYVLCAGSKELAQTISDTFDHVSF